jgi:hypothetical protein
MARYKIKFDNTSINESLQLNDNVYISGNLTESGGFNTADTPTLVGPVVHIDTNYIHVETDVPSFPPTSGTHFFSFIKDSKVNISSIVGEYAEVTLKNNSTGKAELFSLGSEVALSSK